jgi:hypothetical protein
MAHQSADLREGPLLWRLSRYRPVYYGNQRQLEYDFVVAPGADASGIRLQFTAGNPPRIDASGSLMLGGAQGQIVFHKPLVYQNEAGQRRSIPGSFRQMANNTVGFTLGSYDHTRPLIIDPILVYSTYLGGSGTADGGDEGKGIAVDSAGDAYVVGTTFSTDFPTSTKPYQGTNKAATAGHGGTVFVTEFNPSGTALIYSTYLGGSGIGAYTTSFGQYGPFGDNGVAIAIDADGNAYLTGNTYSKDFPVTTGALQVVNKSAPNSSPSAFVAKLSSGGDSLLYSTYLGGTVSPLCYSYIYPAEQGGQSITVDKDGNAYVSGATTAADFPVTPGAFRTKYQASALVAPNGFVSKLNPTGTALVYSTYLGGSGSGAECYVEGDEAYAITIDTLGDAYVAGSTVSSDFPVTTGALKTANTGGNAFVTKLNPTGSAEIYSTYLGGSGHDRLNGTTGDFAVAIAVDPSGDAYVDGVATSSDLPATAGVIYPTPPGQPGSFVDSSFVAKLNPEGSSLDYLTYLGQPNSSISGLAIDSSGDAFVTGATGGSILPSTPDAIFQLNSLNQNPPYEAFVAKLDPEAKGLDFGSMLAAPTNSSQSSGNAVALDSSGNLYVTGSAAGNGFTVTSGAFQTTNKNTSDRVAAGNAFVAKLALAGDDTPHLPTTTVLSVSASLYNPGQAVILTATVTGPPGGPVPTGMVTFGGPAENTPGTIALPAVQVSLNSSGVATWSSTSLPPGAYTANVYYAGDANHLSCTASTWTGGEVSFRVVGPPAKVSFIDLGNSTTTYGQELSFLYLTVEDASGYALQGIPVSFSGAGLTFSPSSTLTAPGGISTTFPSAAAAGSYTATATVTGYPTPLTLPITVLPAPLKVTLLASAKARYYGSPNPNFGDVVTGLIGSDTVNVTISTTAAQLSPVGAYPITVKVTGSDIGNYAVTVVGFMLEVIKAPLYISARNVPVTYGQTPPKLTAYGLTGFVNGDTTSVVSGAPVLSTTVTSTTPVGFYKIGVQVGTLTAANYYFNTFSNGEGSVGVYKAPLEATVNNLTMTQGGPVPPLTYTLTGFVNGDTQATAVTGAAVLNTTATPASKPGDYPILFSRGTLAAENYAFIGGANGLMRVVP